MSGWHCWGAYVIPSPLACPGCFGAGGERDVAKAEGMLSTCCLRRNRWLCPLSSLWREGRVDMPKYLTLLLNSFLATHVVSC